MQVTIADDLQEFTYLSPVRCANTRASERQPMVATYWRRVDPDHREADGAESFRDLVARVDRTLARWELGGEGLRAVFSHGQWMQCVAWWLARRAQRTVASLTQGDMVSFRGFSAANPVENTARMTLQRRPSGYAVESLLCDHLPDGWRSYVR